MACGCSKGSAGGRNPNIEYMVTGKDGKLDPTRYATSGEARAKVVANGGGSFKPVEAKRA